MALSTVPTPLEDAIDSASAAYDVPKDLLEGIWRVESGSSYPNPYVNSSGYGGLFGTTNWNDTTQGQANEAASVLASLLKSDNGNIEEALSGYSGGGGVVPPKTGYDSVPGETTFGVFDPVGGTAASGLNPGTNTQQQAGTAAPAGSQTGSTSLASNVSLSGLLGLGEAEKVALRIAEMLFGVGLVALGLVGIYLALSKTSVAKTVGGAVGTLGDVARSGEVKRQQQAAVEAKAGDDAQRRTYRELSIEQKQFEQTHRETIAAERVKQEKAKTREARAATRARLAKKKRVAGELPPGY